MSDCIGTGCKADALMLRIRALEVERDALLKFHEHVCVATNLANTSPDVQISVDGRAIRDVLRDALINYADAIDAYRKGAT